VSLYLDTSALVKLYVQEAGSAEVARQVDGAAVVATSRVAYPEARAALARRCREGAISAPALRRAVSALDRDLGCYVVVELVASVARRAGALAEQHSLRGFDAIHLASALELAQLGGVVPAFMAYDRAINAAAAAEGLQLP
jgi:predicted nucleic acid-binding protein